jgi:hypothetical protein
MGPSLFLTYSKGKRRGLNIWDSRSNPRIAPPNFPPTCPAQSPKPRISPDCENFSPNLRGLCIDHELFQHFHRLSLRGKEYRPERAPPSTSRISPVMCSASCEARKSAARAISSGLPIRPHGIMLTSMFLYCCETPGGGPTRPSSR